MSSSDNNITFKKTSFLSGINSEFINKLYLDYLSDPGSLPGSWKKFFDGLSEDEKLILIIPVAIILAFSLKVLLSKFGIYGKQNANTIELKNNILKIRINKFFNCDLFFVFCSIFLNKLTSEK